MDAADPRRISVRITLSVLTTLRDREVEGEVVDRHASIFLASTEDHSSYVGRSSQFSG